MNNIVFVTNQQGPKRLWDKDGLIGKFKNSNNNIVTPDDGVPRRDMRVDAIWYMVIDADRDADKVERAKKYPGFGTSFNITDEEPVWNTVSNLRTIQDPNAASAINANQIKADVVAEQQEELENQKRQNATDMRRYGILFSKVCKAGGAFLADADPKLVEEFKQLRDKHGITEEPVAEVA